MKKSTASAAGVTSVSPTSPQLQSLALKRETQLRQMGSGSAARPAQRQRATSLRSRSRVSRRSARNPETAPNYASRMLAGEFEPTALRCRDVARNRGQSLHELAHELGYAGSPPAVRSTVDLGKLTRSELAARVGCKVSDMSRLLARKHQPSVSKLAKVAAAYGAWMDDVLTALGW